MFKNCVNLDFQSSSVTMETPEMLCCCFFLLSLFISSQVKKFWTLVWSWIVSCFLFWSSQQKDAPPQKSKYMCCCCLFIFPGQAQTSLGVPAFMAPAVFSLSVCLCVSPQKHLNLNPHDGTTHTVSCTKRLECYKHLFQLKRRVFMCICMRSCVTRNVWVQTETTR